MKGRGNWSLGRACDGALMLGSRMRAKSGEGLTCEKWHHGLKLELRRRAKAAEKSKMSVQCDVKGTGHGVGRGTFDGE